MYLSLLDFSDMLEFLHTLTINQRVVFSSINNNAEFIASLCYHLLILTGAILPEHSSNIELTDPDTITGTMVMVLAYTI